MADVLKQTLFWSSVPDIVINDNSGAGDSAEARAISAAESHDASDSTYESLTVNDDGADNVNGDTDLTAQKAVGTASVSGPISFVRVKARARDVRTAGSGPTSGTWQPIINGTNRGGPQSLGSSFADFSQDFTTDPADSAAWTNAKVNAQTFGVDLHGVSTDPAWSSNQDLRLSEFSVELWGPDVQVSTPASVALSAVVNAGNVSPGPVGSSPASVALTVTPNVGSSTLGLRVVTPDAVELALVANTGVFALANDRDPSATGPQALTLDATGQPVTVRSFKASLNDQTVSTKDVFTSPSSWANGGTQLQPLYGTASQGVQGSSGAGNGINGSGIISGIKLHAIVRASKSVSGSSITNMRFGTAMGLKALLAPPTIYDFAATPTDAMFEHVESNLITTGQFGNPFTWGNGTDSVWASLFGWTFNHTYANAASTQFTRVEVAEAWVEIIGPMGNSPEIIELTHVIGSNLKTVQLSQEV